LRSTVGKKFVNFDWSVFNTFKQRCDTRYIRSSVSLWEVGISSLKHSIFATLTKEQYAVETS